MKAPIPLPWLLAFAAAAVIVLAIFATKSCASPDASKPLPGDYSESREEARARKMGAK